ncbi:MAG TPA: hypothetical protein VJ697_03490 [Nitrososphaeraceae archaeon]|nr:hypothetical protein [Nitrososphaeraceae archaeon]
MYSTEKEDKLEFNQLLDLLIQKNLFTQRQITIIYNKLNNENFKYKISSGAYYRQVKQCKNKYYQLIYTILLFRVLNLIDNDTINTIETVAKQMINISQLNQHHNTNITKSNDIIQVIDQIIKKISSF